MIDEPERCGQRANRADLQSCGWILNVRANYWSELPNVPDSAARLWLVSEREAAAFTDRTLVPRRSQAELAGFLVAVMSCG